MPRYLSPPPTSAYCAAIPRLTANWGARAPRCALVRQCSDAALQFHATRLQLYMPQAAALHCPTILTRVQVRLSFTLPPSSYATMCLRELTKQSTELGHQQALGAAADAAAATAAATAAAATAAAATADATVS